MKGRFPPDLFVVVFGPVLIIAIALGLGSFLFRAAQFRDFVGGYAVAAAVVILVGLVLVLLLRRRGS